jgi:PEP-CTERM motif
MPEPSILMLLAIGIFGVAFVGRKRVLAEKIIRIYNMGPLRAPQTIPIRGVVLRFLFVLLLLSLVCARAARADGWGSGAVVTYNQSEWGDQTNVAGMLMSANFDSVYPSDLFVIGSTTPGFSALFTNEADVDDFLPTSGLPGALDANLVNPATTSAGVFGGEVAALKLNLDFSNAGLIPNSSGLLLGNLVLTGFSGSESSLNGLTVEQFFALSEAALAGQATSIDFADIDNVTSNINDAFDGGQPDAFAQDHLVAPGSTAAMPEPSTVMLLAIGIFGVAFVGRKRVLA